MKFTKNEKVVIKELISDGRATDADIARKLKISLQGVRKIRQKLEANGVILGYKAVVNYDQIGLNAFAIAMLRATPKAWEKFGGKKLNEWLMHDNVIKFYRLPRGEISHTVVYGFRDMKELNHFFENLQEQHSRHVEIVRLYTFSNENFGKKSVNSLIRKILNEGEKEILPKPDSLD